MDELKDVYNHFLLYYGRDIPKMQNAAKASRKKLKRVREEGDEEGECWRRRPGGLVAMAFPRMPLTAYTSELLSTCVRSLEVTGSQKINSCFLPR